MKYLAWVLILAGLVSILCEIESCRRSYSARASAGAIQPYVDADADAITEEEQFIWIIGGGIVTTCLGLYLRSRLHPDFPAAKLAERLSITRLIFCPKCGRPLRINESCRIRLLGFVPRPICCDCKAATEFSGAAIFGMGVVLAFGGGFLFLDGMFPIPFISILIGLSSCLIGIVRWQRQFSKAKRYTSQQMTKPK